MVAMHGAEAETVAFTDAFPDETNYSIYKHGIGNKTTAISLMISSGACAGD